MNDLQAALARVGELLDRANLGELQPFGGHVDGPDGDTVADCYYNAAHDQQAEHVAQAFAAAINLLRQHLPELQACVRDARRYRHVITRGKLPTRTTAGYHYEDGVSYATPETAIDAAIEEGG